MRRAFADTHFLLALLNERDVDHVRACEWWNTFREGEISTTEWVLVELANGMSRGQGRKVCGEFIEELRATRTIKIIDADSNTLWRGFELYRRRADKDWSLTDCISFIAMTDEGLSEALTGDRHFQQAGYTALLV